MATLVKRELAIQKYLEEGFSFDEAHEEILKIPYAIIHEKADFEKRKSSIPLPELPKTFCEEIDNAS